MKASRIHTLILAAITCFISVAAGAQAPDTVRTGIYITSIHDIDFRQKEYSINFWLWFNYTNPDLNFMQNVEIPQSKSVTKSYAITDSSDGHIYTLMKMEAVMKDSWRTNNFPFDRQTMRMSVENAQFDASSLIFVADTVGQSYDPRFTVSGWNIDSFSVKTGIKEYETGFGDPAVDIPHTEYGTFKVKIGIKRDAWGLFMKIFLGMYVAFMIAFVCFFIHADNIDSRFGLSVGSLFAVIGNKYIIDSSLPEGSTFTLVDTLHGLTLVFIFCVISCSIHSLTLSKRGELFRANVFDMRSAKILLAAYLVLNLYFIGEAVVS